MSEEMLIRASLAYACETSARLSELRIRLQNAKHFIRRREPVNAEHELMRLKNEAEKLIVHLAAWENYNQPPTSPTQ